MATRVQTQLLPEAPNLQPTISAGGRYTVQVQQAGKNKWNDLADALSQVNPALREFTAAQKLEAEIFANEQLQRKPEEVLADLKKQAEPFNKMTRKGGLPLIGNPFAVMQNKRTMGQIAARAFRIDLENELDVAPADETPEQTYQRVRQQFEQEHPRLVDENGRPALGTGDGFQAELNEYLPAVLRSSEKLRNEKAKAESRVVAGENLASNFKQDIMSPKVLAAWAADTAHMTPAEQRTVISSVAKSLAQGGDNPELAYNEAMAFLNEAKNLPIGNAKLGSKLKGKDEGERVFAEFSTYISDVEAGLEDIRERRESGDNSEKSKVESEVLQTANKEIQKWLNGLDGVVPDQEDKITFTRDLIETLSEKSPIHAELVPSLVRRQVAAMVEFPKEDNVITEFSRLATIGGNPFALHNRDVKDTLEKYEDKNTLETPPDVTDFVNTQTEEFQKDLTDMLTLTKSGDYTIEIDGKEVTRVNATQTQKLQDQKAWESARRRQIQVELEKHVKDKITVRDALQKRTTPTDTDDFKSVINGQPVGKQTKMFATTAFDVENQLNKKNLAQAKKEADRLTTIVGKSGANSFDRIVAAAYGNEPPEIREIGSQGASVYDKPLIQTTEEARRKILMVLLAQGKLNETSILEGSTKLTWGRKGQNEETFKIEDTEAVGALAKSYPILSTDFVQEFVVTYEALFDGKQDQDVKLPNKYPFNQARDVFKKIYGVSKISDEQLKQFVEQQYSLHKAFKTIQ